MTSLPFPPSPLEDDLAYNCYRLSQLLREEMMTRLKQLGISATPEQIHLLFCIETEKDGMKPTELACMARRDKTTISRMIETMTNNGFVERRLSNSDGRSYLICLTKSSRAIIQQIRDLQRPITDSTVLGSLSNAEHELLLALVQKSRRHAHDL